MPRKKMSSAECSYCQQSFAKNMMTKHLASCAARQVVISKAEASKKPAEKLYYLRAQDVYGGDFWLELEVRAAASLKDLDHYLREIWLECCGHMSEFSTGGWGTQKMAMTRKIGDVFKPDVELLHYYDFGTTSETKVKFVDMREGVPTTKHPMALMARNLIPEMPCIECKNTATMWCNECLIEDGVPGFLCDAHATTHPHEDYGEPIPLVNSPRLGMCGYEGPAEPPY